MIITFILIYLIKIDLGIDLENTKSKFLCVLSFGRTNLKN
jgi:hypothetical protein